jgi:hypothetical protein
MKVSEQPSRGNGLIGPEGVDSSREGASRRRVEFVEDRGNTPDLRELPECSIRKVAGSGNRVKILR